MGKNKQQSQSAPFFQEMPASLRDDVDVRWQSYCREAEKAGLEPPFQPDFLRSAYRVMAASEFVARTCIRHPEILTDLLDSGDLLSDYAADELLTRLRTNVAGAENDAGLKRVLRHFRQREMVRIAWRDLAGWASLEEVLRDLSRLADACVGVSLETLFIWQCQSHGVAAKRKDGAVPFVVLGMGKLGADELNFSSDIDLVFAWPDNVRLKGLRKDAREAFFAELGQSLISALADRTEDGFVYRVDMRLRPWGDSGPLALSFSALEEYYQSHGREWERYALIKARPVAGEAAAGVELMALLRPFVYRRYVDYGVFEQLRGMKAMIEREVTRRSMHENIKLGPGGIREIEFIAQVFQLVRGGREPRLRERRLLMVLKRLSKMDLMPAFASERLADAYRFLRRVENRLQAWDDEQVHALPDEAEARARLAYSMGYASWKTFQSALGRHRQFVQEQFDHIFAAPQREEAPIDNRLESFWLGQLDNSESVQVLQEAGFSDVEEALRIVTQFRDGSLLRMVGSNGRSLLERLMPLLLGAIGEGQRPDETLMRVIHLVEAVAGRSTYLSLLIENPIALSQLVRLCGASPWVANELSSHPLLLDELLDPRQLYAPLHRADLEALLQQRLDAIPAGDLEQQMDALRQFKQASVLRVAAADVMGVAPLMVVSDYLTDIAEVVLASVLELSWQSLVRKHGQPHCEFKGKVERPGFAIIGYGKLGGIELGYGSDLDLVFLHNSRGEKQQTDGRRSVDNAVFFARLGQRIIHFLDTLTPAGVLYEVDMRLRPSGASGMLVSSLESLVHYQRQEAWTWEHQALVRARPIAGDAHLADAFRGIRREILCRVRDAKELCVEVRDMRERMRSELSGRHPGQFGLKQDRGGIVDIEFMVQCEILSGAHKRPDLLRYSDNIRHMEGLANAGLMDAADAELLTEAYKAYRARLHKLTLLEEPAVVDASEFSEYRQRVQEIWGRIMGEA